MPGPPAVGVSLVTGVPDQGAEGGRHRRSERGEVVPSLEEEHRPTGRRGIAGHHAGQPGEVAGGEGEVGQRVGPVGVEAGRDQHPGGGERRRPPGVTS